MDYDKNELKRRRPLNLIAIILTILLIIYLFFLLIE